MKKNTKTTTTSLTVDPAIHENFKIKAKGYKLNSSVLLHRSMKLFIEDEEYRSKILNTKD